MAPGVSNYRNMKLDGDFTAHYQGYQVDTSLHHCLTELGAVVKIYDILDVPLFHNFITHWIKPKINRMIHFKIWTFA